MFDGQDVPYRVEWMIKRSGARMEPEVVAAVLGVALPPPDTARAQSESKKALTAVGEPPEVVRVTRSSSIWPSIPTSVVLVGRVSGDLSADTHRILRAWSSGGPAACANESRGGAGAQRADLLGRADGRADDDVARTSAKLADEQQDEKAGARTQSGGDRTGDQDRDPASKRANRHLWDRRPSLTDLRTLRPVQPLIDGLLYRDTLGSSPGRRAATRRSSPSR